MANFCTKCGAGCASDARFCDNCGAPLRPAAPIAIPAPLAPSINMPSRRTLAIVGAAAAAVIVGGGVLAWAFSPEAPSAAAFSRAINEHYAKDQAARDQLVCAGNLPYQTDPIRVAEYDQRTRQWLDLLSSAGVYAPPSNETTSGFLPQTRYVYKLTDAGRASVRHNRLCVADGLRVKTASGFEQVQKVGDRSSAVGNASLELAQEAPWLAKSPQREEILKHLDMSTLNAQLPMALVDKKWQVDPATGTQRNMREMMQRRGAEAAAADAAPTSGAGVFDRLKAMFSFGGHPLVGKWTDPTGIASFEFTSDSVIQNGIMTSAAFKVKGDAVQVTPANGGGVSLIFKMRDADHAALDVGMMSIELSRVK